MKKIETELDEARASAAAMRVALERQCRVCQAKGNFDGTNNYPYCHDQTLNDGRKACSVAGALSTNAGREWLERLERLEKAEKVRNKQDRILHEIAKLLGRKEGSFYMEMPEVLADWIDDYNHLRAQLAERDEILGDVEGWIGCGDAGPCQGCDAFDASDADERCDHPAKRAVKKIQALSSPPSPPEPNKNPGEDNGYSCDRGPGAECKKCNTKGHCEGFGPLIAKEMERLNGMKEMEKKNQEPEQDV